VKGFGTVVTGTLVSGRIREEDDLALLPAELTVKARGLQVHGHRAQAAEAGRRVAVNLGGVERAGVTRGDTLCSPHAFEPTRRVDVLIDLLDDARALRHGARIRFHQGTTEVLGRIAVAGGARDSGPRPSAPDSGIPNPESRSGDSEIAPGTSAYARIRFEGPAVLTRGDRFIVRAYSPPVTIGGGVVLDPHPPRSASRSAAARARFASLDVSGEPHAAEESAVLAFMAERGSAGLACTALVSRAGLAPADAEALARTLVARGHATRVGDVLVAAPVLQDLADRLVRAVTAHHAAEPLSEGLPREEAREKLFRGAAPAVFDHVLAALTTSGKMSARDRLAIAGRHLSLSPEETHAR
jgi:selenocysteine-specific elongation factor